MELAVEKLLKEKGIGYRLISLTQIAYTVDDVEKFSEGYINSDEICKTIVLCGKKSGRKTAVLLKGNDRIDFSKVKKLLSEEMTVASAEQVKDAAGVEPGAVCPFLLNVPLFVDRRVLNVGRINSGSGDHHFGLEFNSGDLEKVVNYRIADLAKTITTGV